MKIRNGFVSNSSSSSFLIYGVSFDELTIDGKKLGGWELSEKLSEIFEGTDIDVVTGQDAYYVYVGRSWATVGDDETGSQFRESVKKTVLEKIKDGDPLEFYTHEEAWYNG